MKLFEEGTSMSLASRATRGRWCARFVPVALALGALATSLHAQATEQWYVSPASGTASQRFGAALAVKGDVMATGAPMDDTSAADAGAVDVFRWDASLADWQFEQRLLASDAEAGARFGSAVAIETDLIVVGSPYKDTANGADGGRIYVFRYSSGTWTEEQKLTPSLGTASDHFGTSVAVSSNLIMVGAPHGDTAAGADSGCAFAFRYKGSIIKWVEEKQFVDSDGAASDYAGQSVDIEGSTVAISSHLSDESSIWDSGSVAIWTVSGSTWTQGPEILAPTPQYYANFGAVLDLRSDLLAISAPSEDEPGPIYDSGAVYLYRLISGTWTFEARFTAQTPASYGYFGSDVAVDGKLLVVGYPLDDVSGSTDGGSAYVFRKGKKAVWHFDQEFGATDAAAYDHLGVQVAINDDQFFAAADLNDTASGYDWGVVYGYDRDEINLSIEPAIPLPGETLTFSAFSGTPGGVCMVVIEDVSGTPYFLPLLVYLFAADHTLTFTADAPDPLYGVHVGMRAYKVSPTGPVVFSDLAYVDV